MEQSEKSENGDIAILLIFITNVLVRAMSGEAGCSEIFLFGSLASGEVGDKSDIDLAIRGCPQGKFF